MLRMTLSKIKRAYAVAFGHYVHVTNPSSKSVLKVVTINQKKTLKTTNSLEKVVKKDGCPLEPKKTEADYIQPTGMYEIFTKSITQIYSSKRKKIEPEKLMSQCQKIISQTFGSENVSHNDQNTIDQSSFSHIASSSMHSGRATENEHVKLVTNVNQKDTEQSYNTEKRAQDIVSRIFSTTTDDLAHSDQKSFECHPNVTGQVIYSTIDCSKNVGNVPKNMTHNDKNLDETPHSFADQEISSTTKSNITKKTDESYNKDNRAQYIVSKIFSTTFENVTHSDQHSFEKHLNLVNLSSLHGPDKTTSDDQNVVENHPNFEELADSAKKTETTEKGSVKSTRKDQISDEKHPDLTVTTSTLLTNKTADEILAQKPDKPELKAEIAKPEGIPKKEDKKYENEYDRIQKATQVFSTTTKKHEEEFNQKVEHLDEPPMVVDKAPPNEGLNITPRVLGNENSIQIASPLTKKCEEVSKDSFNSQASHVDEFLLRDIEKMGVPLESSYNTEIETEDGDLIKHNFIQNPHRYADKLYYEYMYAKSKLEAETATETRIPELLILEPLLIREPLLPNYEMNLNEYPHIIHNPIDKEITIEEICKPSAEVKKIDEKPVELEKEVILTCTSDKINQDASLPSVTDANKNLSTDYTSDKVNLEARLASVTDVNKKVSTAYASEKSNQEAMLALVTDVNKKETIADSSEKANQDASHASVADVNKNVSTVYTSDKINQETKLSSVTAVNKNESTVLTNEKTNLEPSQPSVTDVNKKVTTAYTSEKTNLEASHPSVADVNKNESTVYTSEKTNQDASPAIVADVNKNESTVITSEKTNLEASQPSVTDANKNVSTVFTSEKINQDASHAIVTDVNKKVCTVYTSEKTDVTDVNKDASLAYAGENVTVPPNEANTSYNLNKDSSPSVNSNQESKLQEANLAFKTENVKQDENTVNTSQNIDRESKVASTRKDVSFVRKDISQSPTITCTPKEDMYDFANTISIEVENTSTPNIVTPVKPPAISQLSTFKSSNPQSTNFLSTNFQSTNPQSTNFLSTNFQSTNFQSTNSLSTNFQPNKSPKKGKVDEIVLGLGVMVKPCDKPLIKIRKRRDVRQEPRMFKCKKRQKRPVEKKNVTLRLADVIGPLPSLDEQLPLSELLNRVRKRNKIQQIHNTLQSMLVNQPTGIKIKKSPTGPRSPPANPVPPLPPGPPPLKQKPPVCKPKRPRRTKATAFVPLAILNVSNYMPIFQTAVQLPFKAVLSEEILQRLAMILNSLVDPNGKIQLDNARFLDSILLARDYEPWVPIPCWPQPKKPNKRKLLCPKDGCPFPPPGMMKDPDPPAKPHSCKDLPRKKQCSSPTEQAEIALRADFVFFGMFILSQLMM